MNIDNLTGLALALCAVAFAWHGNEASAVWAVCSLISWEIIGAAMTALLEWRKSL